VGSGQWAVGSVQLAVTPTIEGSTVFLPTVNCTLNKMLTHVVIWKYRADVEPEVREEHVAMLHRLASVIKQVESLQVGFDLVKLPRSFDTGLVAVFRDRAALDAYTIHPEHIKVAAFGKVISEQVASVDFES
jgi:predicted signal transduction protein with EAL and GGDEF domain